MDGVIQAIIKLQNVSQNKRERVTESRFLPKGVVVKIHPDLTDSDFLCGNPSYTPQPPDKSYIRESVSFMRFLRMINLYGRIFSVWAIEIPVK